MDIDFTKQSVSVNPASSDTALMFETERISEIWNVIRRVFHSQEEIIVI